MDDPFLCPDENTSFHGETFHCWMRNFLLAERLFRFLPASIERLESLVKA